MTIISSTALDQLRSLADHLNQRREDVLRALEAAAVQDSEMMTVSMLTHGQFRDHLPGVIEGFVRRLRTWRGERLDAPAVSRVFVQQSEAKHGLHRWQQGYRLRELAQEWGHLHLTLLDELDNYSLAHPELEPGVMSTARRELVRLISEGVRESTSRYAKLEEDEAAGHERDLQRALAQLADLERQRAELLREAIHDIGGNVQAVSTATLLLGSDGLHEEARAKYLDLLQVGVDALSLMLGDLMSQAKLEAGHERRDIASFDAAACLAALCARQQGLAQQRGLYLQTSGPTSLVVQGDQGKMIRIAQNLIINALKYTEEGGVVVSWNMESGNRWSFSVRDTGPGLKVGPRSLLAEDIKKASDSAGEAHAAGSPPLPQVELPVHQDPQPAMQHPAGDPPSSGEGIGLSIVKRLCDLLDGTLELESEVGGPGSVFRVILPMRYSQISER